MRAKVTTTVAAISCSPISIGISTPAAADATRMTPPRRRPAAADSVRRG